MSHQGKYDRQTSIEAILYLSNRLSEPSLHRVFKLMYFADRHHLENFGRLIFGDNYIAMKHGPVPSRSYDLTKVARGERNYLGFDSDITDYFSVTNTKDIVPFRDANVITFSESEVECLDYAISNYGDLPFRDLTDLSHDESWKAADVNDRITIEALTLGMQNREELLAHLRDPLP